MSCSDIKIVDSPTSVLISQPQEMVVEIVNRPETVVTREVETVVVVDSTPEVVHVIERGLQGLPGESSSFNKSLDVDISSGRYSYIRYIDRISRVDSEAVPLLLESHFSDDTSSLWYSRASLVYS